MRKINLTKESYRFLKGLDSKQFLQLLNKISELTHNPRPADSISIKGEDNLYRTDIGEYRIIYFFDETLINITVIAKRNDDEAYKKMKRSH